MQNAKLMKGFDTISVETLFITTKLFQTLKKDDAAISK